MTDFTARLAALRSEPSTDAANDANRLARVERTRAEMLDQGPAIARTLQSQAAALSSLAQALGGREIRHVVILGCGDSWFAGMAAGHGFRSLLGVPATAAQAFDYANYDVSAATAATLVFGLSASGTTPAVLAALAAARGHGAFTVGVSNSASSPLATSADFGLTVSATRRGWPTQSTTAAIAVLIAAALEIAKARGAATVDSRKGPANFDRPPPNIDPLHGSMLGGGAADQMDADLAAITMSALRQLPDDIAGLLAELDHPMATLAADFATAGAIFLTGAGPGFAAAAIGAAKIKELAPIHAVAVPLEEMHHYRLPKVGDPLFVVAPDHASRERALDTVLIAQAVGARAVALLGRADAEIGARVAQAFTLPCRSPLLAPIVHAIPLHLFAYHFARRRAGLGLGYPGVWPAPA